MKNILRNTLILILLTSISSCKENIHPHEIKLIISKATIDTLEGLEFAYRLDIANASDTEVNFYTGPKDKENQNSGGFYLKFKSLERSYQMSSLTKYNAVRLHAKTKNNKIILGVCFREYCNNFSDFAKIFDTYYKSKNKKEDILQLIKDISIEYKPNKTWNDKNYQLALKNDSVISFNHLDTVNTSFTTEITGETFSQMLKN